MTISSVDPQEISNVEYVSEPVSIEIIGNHAYVCQVYRIRVYDISDPHNLQYCGAIDLPGIQAMTYDGNFIYAVAKNDGLYVIK